MKKIGLLNCIIYSEASEGKIYLPAVRFAFYGQVLANNRNIPLLCAALRYMRERIIKMKKKSIAAIAAAAAIIFSNAAPVYVPVITAYAEEASASRKKDDKKQMEELLAVVKTRVDIPEDYSEFSYSKNSSHGTDSYTFTWRKSPDDYMNCVTVEIDENKVITNYYTNEEEPVTEYNYESVSFAKLSRSRIVGAAENAVKTLNPDIAGEIKAKDDFYIGLRGDTVTVRIHREKNGLVLSKNSGSVTLNKNTGELESFYLNWWSDADFEDPSAAISNDEMEKVYRENVKLTPYYQINAEYNEETKEFDRSAVILYSPEEDTQFDAATGKPTTMLDDYALAYNTSRYDNGVYDEEEEVVEETEAVMDDAAPATGIGEKRVVFSAAEKKAIMDSGKYYTKDDITDLLKEDKYLGLTDDYMSESANFDKNEVSPSGYAWSMYFFVNNSKEYKYINVVADAESGKIISFYKYSKNPSKAINVKSVNKVAEAAAKYYLGERFDEYKPAGSNTAEAREKEVSRTVVFDRYANDLLVADNRIKINVDSEGNVTSFSYVYDDIKLPEPKLIGTDEAYKKAFAQTDFDLYYDGFTRLNGEPQTYMLFSVDKFYLNAATGKLCTSSGKEITASADNGLCPYTDIKGNSAEKYITKLYEYGVRLTGKDETEFRPDEYITEREFADLMESVSYTGIMPLLYADYSYERPNEFGNGVLTKAGAAKQFVIARSGKQFAELKGIYVSPFKDVSADRSDLGYISLAYGMGVIKGDSKGCFNPDSKVTRGYAMYLICNYIENA